MDLRIQSSNTAAINADKLYQQQRSKTSNTTQNEEQNFLKTLIEKEEKAQVEPARETVLTMPEMATLHVLFGSEKPGDSNFYGRNNAAQIYKGHLLDVAG